MGATPTIATVKVAGLAGFATLAACTPFRFEAQEVSLRHQAERDLLEVGILYEGLHDEDEEQAASVLSRLAMGERVFVIYDWPFVADLDDEDEPLEVDPDGKLPEELRRRLKAVVESVHVTGAGLFQDEAGHLGAWQRVVLPRASEAFAAIDGLISLAVIESLEDDGEDCDERTSGLLRAHAEGGGPWLRLVDGGFEVCVPLSRPGAADLLRTLMPSEPADEESELMERADEAHLAAGLLAPLTEIEFADELLVLRFLPDESGWLRFRFRRPSWTYDGLLAEELGPLPERRLDAVRGDLLGDD